jgi:hypothetical protein
MDKVLVVLGGFVFLVFLSLLLSLPMMWLWNSCLVGAVDGVREIGWLQAWGINILCNCLFKTTGVKS